MVYAIDGFGVALVVAQISEEMSRSTDEMVAYFFSFERRKMSLQALDTTVKPLKEIGALNLCPDLCSYY